MIYSHRFQLLRRAWKEGTKPLIRQAALLLREALIFRKLLIFMVAADELQQIAVLETGMLDIRCYERWENVEPKVRKMLADSPNDFWWDTSMWLSQGWHMWAGFVNDQLAVVCWTRNAQQSAGFVVPLEADASLIWQTTTAAVFRERGLFTQMLHHVTHRLVTSGNKRLYVSCLESNVASRRGIERVGFRRVGHAVSRTSKHWRWVSERGAVPA